MCWNHVPETASNKKVSSHKRGHLLFGRLLLATSTAARESASYECTGRHVFRLLDELPTGIRSYKLGDATGLIPV